MTCNLDKGLGIFELAGVDEVLMYGDCLELMKNIPDKSIDMVLTDPPYGTTACKWDSVIPFEPMWEQLRRITKDSGAICLFGSEPFSSHLRLSNLKMFKYDWVWMKKRATLFQHANKRPMKKHENISVFYKKLPTYNPQYTKGKPYIDKRTTRKGMSGLLVNGVEKIKKPVKNEGKRYPVSLIGDFCGLNRKHLHPTQKPVALLEYLIKTYTVEGETVLDFTMGSGSTGVAAKNIKRKFIGIEKEEKYFKIAEGRINDLRN